jgi:hypothetical protein
VESNDIMTYYGGLLRCCVVRRRDVIGIAHGEESIDRALLVATHRVDDGVPIRYEQGKIDHISRSSWKCGNDGGVVYISSQNGRIEIRKDRVQLGYLGICKLIDGQLWRSSSDSSCRYSWMLLPPFLLARRCLPGLR